MFFAHRIVEPFPSPDHSSTCPYQESGASNHCSLVLPNRSSFKLGYPVKRILLQGSKKTSLIGLAQLPVNLSVDPPFFLSWAANPPWCTYRHLLSPADLACFPASPAEAAEAAAAKGLQGLEDVRRKSLQSLQLQGHGLFAKNGS